MGAAKHFVFLGFVLLALVQCTMPSIRQPISVETFYMRDIDLTVNGQHGTGILTAPKNSSYSIIIKSQGELSFVSIKSCHREIAKEQVPNKQYSYLYIPQEPLETDGCPLEIAGFDASGGQNSWGFIAFEDPDGVPAHALCNDGYIQGKSIICQAHVGLRQAIEFPEDMLVAKDSLSCDYKVTPAKGKYFEFVMPDKACVLTFMSIATGKTHKLITLGYEDRFLRKNL